MMASSLAKKALFLGLSVVHTLMLREAVELAGSSAWLTRQFGVGDAI
jgi:hypothetical protein